LHDEFLYQCRVDRGEVDHAQQLTPRPGDGPRHVGGRRRGHDVGDRGGIAQRADLADQLVDLGAAFLQGAVEVDVLGEDPVSQRVIPVADQLFG
jgi:hypothetical protein